MAKWTHNALHWNTQLPIGPMATQPHPMAIRLTEGWLRPGHLLKLLVDMAWRLLTDPLTYRYTVTKAKYASHREVLLAAQGFLSGQPDTALRAFFIDDAPKSGSQLGDAVGYVIIAVGAFVHERVQRRYHPNVQRLPTPGGWEIAGRMAVEHLLGHIPQEEMVTLEREHRARDLGGGRPVDDEVIDAALAVVHSGLPNASLIARRIVRDWLRDTANGLQPQPVELDDGDLPPPATHVP